TESVGAIACKELRKRSVPRWGGQTSNLARVVNRLLVGSTPTLFRRCATAGLYRSIPTRARSQPATRRTRRWLCRARVCRRAPPATSSRAARRSSYATRPPCRDSISEAMLCWLARSRCQTALPPPAQRRVSVASLLSSDRKFRAQLGGPVQSALGTV